MSNVIHDVNSISDRARADRPTPAVPLFLLALVVSGALIVALIRASQVTVVVDEANPEFATVNGPMPIRDPVRLLYWVTASIVAYLLAIWIARRQGYRRGLWVDRRPLVVAGLVALAIAVAVAVGWFAPGWFAPGDLLIRGNVPLLAIAVGIAVWAMRERRRGLWIVAAIIVPLTLMANLYNTENLLFRLGLPVFENADEIANLGAVAVALFAASAAFALLHQRGAHRAGSPRPQSPQPRSAQ